MELECGIEARNGCAAEGEGLGNQFLGHIMEVDLILHVLRCFEGRDITHVHSKVDPIDDFETICTELMLKDLDSVIKREEKLTATLAKGKARGLSANEIKILEAEQNLIKKSKEALEEGSIEKVKKIIDEAKKECISTIPILSSKNFLIIANLSDLDFSDENYKNNGSRRL